MSQLMHQNATAGHPLARVATVLDRAEALCRAVAGRDLGETPLYIVAQSALPPGYYAGDYHFGFTTPSLDLYLREYIPNWRGRGPCMVINDLGFADDFDPVDLEYVLPTSVLHELAHILDRPALFADRTGADPNKMLFESLVIANSTKRPPPDDLPAYFGHEAGFIRIALHLCHRAEQAGLAIAPAAICAGHRYGLSHATDYQDALGDEPARYADMLFRNIAATAPPPAFPQLWAQDFVSYHDRFSHYQGAYL